MTDQPIPPAAPIAPEGSAAEAARLARQAREAAALRENLRKRRLQGQQRSALERALPASVDPD
jgi:hypothetical protein